MTWADFHKKSEVLASEAEAARRDGDVGKAQTLYARAAEAESIALDQLDNSKTRTLGISAVSAAALRYKAKQYAEAQQLAYKWLGTGLLPKFAEEQLRALLQCRKHWG